MKKTVIDYRKLREYNDRKSSVPYITDRFYSITKKSRPPASRTNNDSTSDKNSSRNLKQIKMSKDIFEDRENHDVRLYTGATNKSNIAKTEINQIDNLDKLVNKKSEIYKTFKQTQTESQRLRRLLEKIYPKHMKNWEPTVKQMGSLATVKNYKLPGMAIPANASFFMVLSGSVLKLPKGNNMPRADASNIKSGEWFKRKESGSEDFTYLTEENSSILTFHQDRYQMFKLRYNEKVNKEKVQLIRMCKSYCKWSAYLQQVLADNLEWEEYPAQHIIAHEGEVMSKIFIVSKGACDLIKLLKYFGHDKDGKKIVKTQKVVISSITKYQSFGEFSVAKNLKLSYSVITRSKCVIGTFDAKRLKRIDATIGTLLEHFPIPNTHYITDTKVKQMLLEYQKDKRWKKFKEKVISDWIQDYGIEYGKGKWIIRRGLKNKDIFKQTF